MNLAGLPLVGEVVAVGLITEELQQKLVGIYTTKITTKEVTVAVQSSAFPVFVTSSVIHLEKFCPTIPSPRLKPLPRFAIGGRCLTCANKHWRLMKIRRVEDSRR